MACSEWFLSRSLWKKCASLVLNSLLRAYLEFAFLLGTNLPINMGKDFSCEGDDCFYVSVHPDGRSTFLPLFDFVII